MNSSLVTSLFSAALLLAVPVLAQSSAAPKGDSYPLKTCVVSDEKLEGDIVKYVHKEAGKPDREVRFCCDGCIDDFKKSPAKFLAKLDAAGKSAPTPAQAGQLVPVTEKDATWAANARKAYPLEVCVASGEKLGSMGKSPEYIYRADGQPDRLVVFCCSGCEEDFMKDPASHFAKIASAAKTKAASAGKSEPEARR